MSEHDAHSLPAGHALDLAELAQTWQVPRERLFAGLDLAEEKLAQPDARISLRTMIALIERARQLTGEAALGFHLGMQMRVPAHGYLGFAAMTASSLREALKLAVRYAPTRTSALRLLLKEEDGEAHLVIDEVADLGGARDVVVIALIVGLWQIGEALTGIKLSGSADLAFPRPSYAERFDDRSLPVRYGQPSNRLRFAAALLDVPLRLANPSALRLAQEQCERELSALGQVELARRVRDVLPRAPYGFHDLEQVAAKLGVSPRTLKRKLKLEGAAFSTLRDELACEQARALLASAELSLQQVAERVGYSDVSNFGRAFRRWTGTNPAAYRRGLPGPGRAK